MKPAYEAKTGLYQEEERSPAKECRLYRIGGRVQGVWFRESTRREAQLLGLTTPERLTDIMQAGRELLRSPLQ